MSGDQGPTSNGQVRSSSINFSRPRRDDTLPDPNQSSELDVNGLSDRRFVTPSNSDGRLGVPQHGQRESRLGNEDLAEDIFDLYGSKRESNGAGSIPNDAQPAPLSAQDKGVNDDGRSYAQSYIDLTRDADVDGHHVNGHKEVITDRPPTPDSPASWEGVMSALQVESDPQRDSLLIAGSNPTYSIPTPPITVTPDKSSLRERTNVLPRESLPFRGRESTMTASTSTSASLHPSSSHTSMARLSPMPTSGRASDATFGNSSVASFSGSSQYPGEDNEAFHVRSTYARLDAEGVHGDGWDPGVERTRGGPNASKRNTVELPNSTGEVDEKERGYLAGLDRYGFVNEPLRNRSETRLALIPSAPFRKFPKLPSKSPIPPGPKPQPPPHNYGPSSDNAPSPRPPPSPRPENQEDRKHRTKEEERVGKWMKMMSVKKRDEGGNIAAWAWRDQQKVLKRVYKGIPDRWRMAAWWTLAEDQTADWKGKGRVNRPAEILGQDFRHQVDLPSTHDVQIDLDVPRTISGHTLFVTRYGAGQRSLFHVLHSFSLLCETCGYCQGMGPIAATLLCYYEPERTYALLVRLHDIYGMHSIFAPGFPGLLEAFYVQERMMEYLMPEVYKSFQRNMISSSAWGTKWYITLFVNTVPFSQQLRLWDAMWMDGRDVIIIVAIAILWSFKDLLSDSKATFESILSLLSSYFVAEDEDALMRWVRKLRHQPGVKERMDGWREEWARLVAEGKSHEALL